MLRLLLSISSLIFALQSSQAVAQDSFSPYQSSKLTTDGQLVRMHLVMKDGAYAYRQKLGFFANGKPLSMSIPAGHIKDDPAFGRVETLSGQFNYSAQVPEGSSEIIAVDQSCSATEGICFPTRATKLNLKTQATEELSMVDAATWGLAWEKKQKEEQASALKASSDSTSSQQTIPSQKSESSSPKSRWGSFAPPGPEVTPNKQEPLLSGPTPAAQNEETGFTLSSADYFSNALSQSPISSVFFFFVAGLLLSMTPCNWPVLPLLSRALLSKQDQHQHSKFTIISSYLLGFGLVYVLLGMLAAVLGISSASFLTSFYGAILIAGLLALMGLSSLGLFEIRIPSALNSKLMQWQDKSQISSPLLATGFSGTIGALLASPCVAAPLAGVLLFCSTQGSVTLAALALLALAVGLCAPLILIALFGQHWLPKSGPWMLFIKQVIGLSLLVLSIRSLSPFMAAEINVGLIGLLLMIFSNGQVIAHRLNRNKLNGPKDAKIPLITQVGIIGIAIVGATQLAGAVSGATDPLRPLSPWTTPTALSLNQVASSSEKNISSELASEKTTSFSFHNAPKIRSTQDLKHFLEQSSSKHLPAALLATADWCANCKSLEKSTLSNPLSQKALEPFNVAVVDLTVLDEDASKLLKHLSLAGPPALLVYQKDAIQPQKRLSGIFSAEDLEKATLQAQ